MEIKWTNKAFLDIERLYDFLAAVNQDAAVRVVQSLTAASLKLLDQPRLGEMLPEFESREVRHLLVGKYELRYELKENTIYILRIWHTKENR